MLKMNKILTQLLLICSPQVSAEIKMENGVFDLNPKNFEEALNEHHNMLVQFCNHKM